MQISRIKTVSFTLLLALAGPVAYGGEFNLVANIGDPMPEFNDLPSVGNDTISSSDLTEDVIVLAFLANHCPWVKGMDGDLVKLVAEMKGRSVKVVGVSVNHMEADRLPAMKAHSAKVGYNFAYVFDESQEIGRKLGAARTPEYFVFNKERELVYMGLLYNSPARMTRDGSVKYTNGDPTEFYVRDAIEAALSGKAAPLAETRAQGCSLEYVQQ
jgi:peroxiredoxin